MCEATRSTPKGGQGPETIENKPGVKGFILDKRKREIKKKKIHVPGNQFGGTAEKTETRLPEKTQKKGR